MIQLPMKLFLMRGGTPLQKFISNVMVGTYGLLGIFETRFLGSALMIVSGPYGPTLSALTKMTSKNEATKLASCVGFTEERKRSLYG